MKKALFALVCVFAFVCPSMAQGVLPPFVPLAFPSALGTAPNALGYVCTFEAGTSTPLATYSDVGLITANQNPIRLNSAGRPAFSGSEVAVYLLPQTYKISWYAAGGVGSPNCTSSSTMGALIKTVDNVEPQNLYSQVFATKLDDKVCHASQYTGANMGAKVQACVAVLPSTGGTIDARGLEGAQSASADLFNGTSKPIVLLLGATTLTITATINVPPSGAIVGLGIASKIIASGLSGELVRLSGDNSYIESVWLHGPGQDANTPDGRRGIWIGCSVLPHTTPCTPTINNRVTNVVIDGFTGNGISGEYTQSYIAGNLIYDTTDAGIFVVPASTKNYIAGNTIRTARYSCIDVNGSYNRVMGNFLYGCGGGNLDQVSWSGILVASIDDSTPASGNIISLNTSQDNLGCGIAVIGLVTGDTIPAQGNIVDSNIVTGHTNTTGAVNFPGGICSWGGDSTTISNNFSKANRDNYVISGSGAAVSSRRVKVVNNQSISATRYGYSFIYTPRIDLAGDFPPTSVDVRGNTDVSAGTTAYRFAPNAANWDYYTIKDNKCFSPAAYCFENTEPTVLTNWDFRDNFGTGAGTAYQTGFVAIGLAQNDATPSVANRVNAITNNTNPTTYTNFTDGYQGQTVQIFIRDAGNSTFDFSANATMVGNNGVDLVSANGDVVTCTLDVGVWYCSIILG